MCAPLSSALYAENDHDVIDRVREAVQAWKDADAAAKAAEDRLKAAWEVYDKDRSQPPSADLMVEVSRLRGIARDRLAVAMMLTNPNRKP